MEKPRFLEDIERRRRRIFNNEEVGLSQIRISHRPGEEEDLSRFQEEKNLSMGHWPGEKENLSQGIFNNKNVVDLSQGGRGQRPGEESNMDEDELWKFRFIEIWK